MLHLEKMSPLAIRTSLKNDFLEVQLWQVLEKRIIVCYWLAWGFFHHSRGSENMFCKQLGKERNQMRGRGSKQVAGFKGGGTRETIYKARGRQPTTSGAFIVGVPTSDLETCAFAVILSSCSATWAPPRPPPLQQKLVLRSLDLLELQWLPL